MKIKQVFKLLDVKLQQPFKTTEAGYQLCKTNLYDEGNLIDVWLLTGAMYVPHGTGIYQFIFKAKPTNWDIVVDESGKLVDCNLLPNHVFNSLSEDKLLKHKDKKWKEIEEQENPYLYVLREPLPVSRGVKAKPDYSKAVTNKLFAYGYSQADDKTWWCWNKAVEKNKQVSYICLTGIKLSSNMPEATTKHTVNLEGQSSLVSYAELCALTSQMEQKDENRKYLQALVFSYFDNRVNLITTNGHYYSVLSIQHEYKPELEGKIFSIKADDLVGFLKTLATINKSHQPVLIDSTGEVPKLVCGNAKLTATNHDVTKSFTREALATAFRIESLPVYRSSPTVKCNLSPTYVERLFVNAYSILCNDGYRWECHSMRDMLYQVVLSKSDRVAVLGLMELR